MSQTREWKEARFQGRFESPDLLVLAFRGTMDLEVAKQAAELYREVSQDGPIYAILDLKDSNVDAAGRTHLSQHVSVDWFQGIVAHGAGFVQKAIIKSLLVATTLLGRKRLDLEFAQNEEEARAAVERMRARHHARRGPQPSAKAS